MSHLKHLITLISCLLLLAACKEQVDKSNRYVFKVNTALDYLVRHPESYSEYVQLLYEQPMSGRSKTSVAQILSARGNYTIFAPTNEAIAAYLDTLVADGLLSEPSWDAFPSERKRDSIRQVIVKNSIIDGGDNDQAYQTSMFPSVSGGEISLPNLNDMKIPVYYSGSDHDILLYNRFKVNDRNQDILVLNGVIHQMESVIAPRNDTAAEYFQQIVDEGREGYLVMARALVACGLKDTLRAVRDEKYEELYETGIIPEQFNTSGVFDDNTTTYAPEHRKYGFTIFAETDDFWQSQGLDPKSPNLLKELMQWIVDQHQYSNEDRFTTDDKYDSPDNLLYQWVTYHILPMKIPADKLVIHRNELGYSSTRKGVPTIAVYELYTTLGKRRLLKIYESLESDGIYLNRFPNLDNGRRGSYHEVSCDMDKLGCRIGHTDSRADLSNMSNCNLYPIDRPLSYNDEVRTNLMRQRLRYDVQSLFPELMNNDIRANPSNDNRKKFRYMPSDEVYRYLDNMWSSRGSHVVCFNYGPGNPSMDDDEIKAAGMYDVTFRLPPVPRRGTYEFRYAILSMPYRGVCQTYFSRDIENRVVTGIPTDMTKNVWSADTGWEQDTSDDDYNADIDKSMRNHNCMKGAMSYATTGDVNYAQRINTQHSCYRMILTRQALDPDETYYITFKNVLDVSKELYLDYFEWCAKEVYDNPETPEDIW